MNAEKILYFAKKNGHAGFNVQTRMNASILSVVNNMVNNKFLVEQKFSNGESFNITEQGELKLLSLQLKARLSISKDIDDLSDLFVDSIESVIGRADEMYTVSLLGKGGSIMTGDSLSARGAKELVRYGIIVHKHGAEKGVFCLTDVGLAVKDKVQARFKPEASPTALDNAKTPEEIKATESPDDIVKSLTQSFGGSLDEIYEEYHGEVPDVLPVSMGKLVLMDLVTEVGEDDAAVYFSMNQNGLDYCIDFEINLRKEAGLPIDGIKEQRVQASTKTTSVTHEGMEVFAPSVFDPKVGFGAYRSAGELLAGKLLGDDLYSKMNELHWDEAHINELPLSEALKELSRHAFAFKNGPPALPSSIPSPGHLPDQVKAVVDSVFDMFGNDLSEEQMKGAIFAMSIQETGIALTQPQLDAAIVSRASSSPSMRR